MPRGVAVCFACATFPTWNAYPAMLASLATGNAVIVKPHPTAILPMALAVRACREVLATAGYSPDLVTLCCDTVAEPVGMRLVKHPRTAIVDFTGSARFGAWVERNAAPASLLHRDLGCEYGRVESVEALDPVVRSLATTMSLFSAQMCTSPQNVYVPRDGIRCGRRIRPEEFGAALADGDRPIAADDRRAGADHGGDPVAGHAGAGRRDDRGRTPARARAARVGALRSPGFPAARTRTPLLLAVGTGERDLYGEERFGPISFVITTADRDAALAEAARDARDGGAITAFVYSTDPAYLERAEQAFSASGAQLTCNLTGPMPLNFAAAYSDYHVTGLNPAGNATLTDLAFVASRFRITQVRAPDAGLIRRAAAARRSPRPRRRARRPVPTRRPCVPSRQAAS